MDRHFLIVVLAVCAAFVVGAGTAAADVITLKNGDSLRGTFVNVTGTLLRFRSDALGTTIDIPVRQVASIELTRPAVVFARARPMMTGELSLDASGAWHVQVEGGASNTIAADTIAVILPADTYDSILHHQASLWQGWSGTGSLGYSIQRGNQETNTFSAVVDAKRERPAAPIFQPHWRTTAHLTALLSNAVEDGAMIESNTLSTSVRQDRLFASGAFVFGLVQYDHVGTQGLTLRQTYGGGAGYDFTQTPRNAFSVFAGLTFVRETFAGGGDQQSAQALVGEKFRYRPNERVQIDHNVDAYPNLSTLGQYHFDTSTSLTVKLTNRFSLTTGAIDLYLTNPAPGSRRNNFALTTGLAVTF